MTRTHRKRRSIWIDVTFSIAIITLTIAAIYLISLSTKDGIAAQPDKNANAVPTPVIVDTIDSNYPGIKIITETSNDTYAPFAIQYPQSLHSEFNEVISAYIASAKQSYLTTMQKNKEQGSDIKGELNISFETLSHHSGNYSFVVVNSSSTGGANNTTEIRSFHLNPETGKAFSIQDVFGNDVKRLETIAALVRDHLYSNPELTDYLFPEELHIGTEPVWENYSNFAITDESIIYYFDEYTLAAGAAGPPIVAIALSDIHELVVDEFKMPVQEQNGDGESGNNEENNNTTPDNPEVPTDGDDTTDENSEGGTPTDPIENGVKKVALTFDDGPDPKVTTQILETLKKYDAKATFFMLGSRVEYYPDIAKNVKDAGHELGNHTWNHPDLTKAGIEKIRNEINRTNSIIEEVTGKQATAFRPPYGAVNATVRNQTDLPVVLWDVDTLDWKHRNPNQLLTKVQEMTKDGSIILMHDIHQATADGLDAVLAYLQSEGYEFLTVSEMEQQ